MTVIQPIHGAPDKAGHGQASSHGSGPARLAVEVVDTMDGFLALRPGWQALEQRDPDGTVFLSWSWLEKAFAQNPHRWRVLVVRPEDQPQTIVCAFPIKYRVHWSKSRNEFQSEIEAGGRLLWSEYTGFLCDPEFEGPAIDLITEQLRAMPWSRLSLRYEATGRRCERLLAGFAPDAYRVRWKEYWINKGQTDNLVSPQVVLPEDYESVRPSVYE